jgi:general secretion pathway protein E/type IV pilus assembly protein PilB
MTSATEIILKAELLQLVPSAQAWHYRVLPSSLAGDRLLLLADEENKTAQFQEELELILCREVELEYLPSAVITQALGKYYRKNEQSPKRVGTFDSRAEDLLPTLIAEARTLGSSDIHLEAYEEKCRVRMRIDGLLIERYVIAREDYPRMVNKVKIKANLDIAEKRLPQDGRIFFNHEGMKFDVRVSVLPTLHGEKVVLRLLSNDATNIDIAKLGFTETELAHFLEGVKRPNGILLVSGPTGSGKTTTLYATLKLLNKEKSNIVTVEDPIEYTLAGINQVQLKESIGLTFASTLRTFLRQDPDIIMLGEIRDGETAQMAIRAALTGHLVLSTIHTNSAWGIVSRLTDMGVPGFLIAGTLNTAIAQRLFRLLCPACKQEQSFNPETLPKNFRKPGLPAVQYAPGGCEHCHFTGYKGRKAIYEVVPIDRDLVQCIRSNTSDVTAHLKEKGIRTLSENAFDLFASGLTSFEEIYPVLLNAS